VNGQGQIVKARDLVEPSIKPGSSTLKVGPRPPSAAVLLGPAAGLVAWWRRGEAWLSGARPGSSMRQNAGSRSAQAGCGLLGLRLLGSSGLLLVGPAACWGCVFRGACRHASAHRSPCSWPLQVLALVAPLIKKLGPAADPANLKRLPVAAGAVWLFYAGERPLALPALPWPAPRSVALGSGAAASVSWGLGELEQPT
jgi:hypothetical protein